MSNDVTLAPVLRDLVHAAAAVASQTDLDELLDAMVEAAMEMTGARYGALGVLGEHGIVTQFSYRGVDDKTAELIGRPPLGKGVLGLISREGKAYRLDDIAEHPAAVGFPDHHPEMDTFLGVPVRAGERIFGNLYLTNKPGGFTESDQVMVEALAEIAGSAVLSIRLQERLRRLAVVEDRERIAHEIHDAIIQELFALGLELQATSLRAEDPEITSDLRAQSGLIDAVIRRLRELIFELRRPPTERRDLRAEIDDLVTRLAGARSTKVDVSYNGVLVGLPTSTVDDVVQLVREALSNALRHAQASTIEVRVSSTSDGVEIEVTDDGAGFDFGAEEPGIGIASMGARTERVGGTLRILSTPGEGTRVSMTLPI